MQKIIIYLLKFLIKTMTVYFRKYWATFRGNINEFI